MFEYILFSICGGLALALIFLIYLLWSKTSQVLKIQTQLENACVQKNEFEKQLIRVQNLEQQRIQDYSKRLEGLNLIFEQQQKERQVQKEKHEAKLQEDKLRLSRQWQIHEEKSEEHIRALSYKLNIEWIEKEKFPHKGKPDNVLKFGSEYLVIDSKSPQGDNLAHFPLYLKKQAEAAKKYASQENVKKDIFFVIPFSSVLELKELFFDFGHYKVHVVTLETLRPILHFLKKIEDYEFAKDLSPEQKEKIIYILGTFSHSIKRRLQNDKFYNDHFIKLLDLLDDLPSDLLEDLFKVEASLKINPPLEQRAKVIKKADL